MKTDREEDFVSGSFMFLSHSANKGKNIATF